jgi:DNA-binding transcriptional LysR family regulator
MCGFRPHQNHFLRDFSTKIPHKRRKMELLQLKYLCTAARLENFSRAARHHNIPQSAISKTIAQLERELGVQLFVRNGNRVSLSEAGRKFCREVQRSLDLLNEATSSLKGGGEEALRGEVHLLVEEHYSELLRLVADFRSDRPGVTFTVSGAPDSGMDYDLRISARSALLDHIGVDDLRGAEIMLLTAATHRLTEWDRVPTAALRGERLVSLSRPSQAVQAAEERLRHAVGALPTVIACDDVHSLCAYVGAGAGIALAAGVSEQVARELGVRLTRLQEEELRYPTCLSYRRPLSPAAAACREAVIARLGKKA